VLLLLSVSSNVSWVSSEAVVFFPCMVECFADLWCVLFHHHKEDEQSDAWNDDVVEEVVVVLPCFAALH